MLSVGLSDSLRDCASLTIASAPPASFIRSGYIAEHRHPVAWNHNLWFERRKRVVVIVADERGFILWKPDRQVIISLTRRVEDFKLHTTQLKFILVIKKDRRLKLRAVVPFPGGGGIAAANCAALLRA